MRHEPVNPPRDRHLGEHAFYDTWRAGANHVADPERGLGDGCTPVEEIVGCLGKPTERDAQVCASMAVWLGTNCGKSIMHEARRHAQRAGVGLDDGYRLVWAEYNYRRSWLNDGVRTVEAVLAGPECYRPAKPIDMQPLGGLYMFRLPDLTARDVEVAERFVVWLSTDTGKAFVERAEKLLESRRGEERRGRQWVTT